MLILGFSLAGQVVNLMRRDAEVEQVVHEGKNIGAPIVGARPSKEATCLVGGNSNVFLFSPRTLGFHDPS